MPRRLDDLSGDRFRLQPMRMLRDDGRWLSIGENVPLADKKSAFDSDRIHRSMIEPSMKPLENHFPSRGSPPVRRERGKGKTRAAASSRARIASDGRPREKAKKRELIARARARERPG